MRLPKLGTRCVVLWTDCVGFINRPLSEAKVAAVWTEGKLVKSEKEFIVIASSQYIDPDEPAAERTGDYTAIPLGMIKSVKRL